MHKKLLLLILPAVAAAIFVSRIPEKIKSDLTEVEYVFPQTITLTDETGAVGSVFALKEYEVYLESPAFIENIGVSVGDKVTSDSLLFTVDTNKTAAVLDASAKTPFVPPNFSKSGDGKSLSAILALTEMYDVDIGSVLEDYVSSSSLGETESRTVYVVPAVYSPINGTVTSVGVKEGTLFQNSVPAAVISDLSVLGVSAEILQSQVGRIKQGSPAVIYSGGAEYSGVVSKIYPTAKKSELRSGEPTVTVEILITEPECDMRAGYSVSVSILGESRRMLATLPHEAIRQDDQGNEFVYLLKNGEIVKQNILTGVHQPEFAEVLEGVGPQDAVIYNPDEKVDIASALVVIKGEAVR